MKKILFLVTLLICFSFYGQEGQEIRYKKNTDNQQLSITNDSILLDNSTSIPLSGIKISSSDQLKLDNLGIISPVDINLLNTSVNANSNALDLKANEAEVVKLTTNSPQQVYVSGGKTDELNALTPPTSGIWLKLPSDGTGVASDGYVTGGTVTGTDNKVLTLERNGLADIAIPFTDLSGTGGETSDGNDFLTGITRLGDVLTFNIPNQTNPTYNLSAWINSKNYLTDVSWADITGKPTIPTNNNQLTNGAGYLTSFSEVDGDITNELQTIAKVGSTVTLSDGGGSFTDADTQLSQEQVQDFVGSMVSGNTESGITVTYDDSSNEFDFSVTASGLDNLGNHIATQNLNMSDNSISGVDVLTVNQISNTGTIFGGFITGNTIQTSKVPISPNDVINKAYFDANSGGGVVQTEGSYTPVPSATTSHNYTTSTANGYYVRTGKQVSFRIFLSNLSGSGTGTFRVSLPFSARGNSTWDLFNVISSNFGGSPSNITGQTNGSQIFFYLNSAFGTAVLNKSFSGATILISGTYITN